MVKSQGAEKKNPNPEGSYGALLDKSKKLAVTQPRELKTPVSTPLF